MLRRISVGALVVLLLSVSSYAAACDLSCGFALSRTDCHSPEMAGADSSTSEMKMAGMKMPEIAGEGFTNQLMVSAALPAIPTHAVLADMGACARQSCDQGQAVASKSDHATAAQFDTISTAAECSHMEILRIAFHESRDDSPTFSPFDYSPLDVSLRV